MLKCYCRWTFPCRYILDDKCFLCSYYFERSRDFAKGGLLNKEAVEMNDREFDYVITAYLIIILRALLLLSTHTSKCFWTVWYSPYSITGEVRKCRVHLWKSLDHLFLIQFSSSTHPFLFSFPHVLIRLLSGACSSYVQPCAMLDALQ